MQTKEQIAETIIKELRELSNKAKDLTDGGVRNALLSELNIDSLDTLEIVMTLEDSLQIEISDKFLDNFNELTVEMFVDHVHQTVLNTTVG